MNIIKLNEFMRFMNSDDSINLSTLEDSSSSTSSDSFDNTPNCNSIVLICVILSIILFVILCICGYLFLSKNKNKRNLEKKDDSYILNNDGTVYLE